MTTGPLPGPTSAYPMFRTPASICLISVNGAFDDAAFVRELASPPEDCACANPLKDSSIAPTLTASVLRKRRRRVFISFDTSTLLFMMKVLEYAASQPEG